MGEKAMKGKAITKVLGCLVVFTILMSVFSVAALATDSANSTASNVTLNLNDKANSSVESMRIMPSGNSDLPDASNTSSPDIINESDEVPDPDLPVINDTDIDTAKTASAMSSCSYVWIKITDKYCKGYKVYVDGVYQFKEDGDGYCCFKVTPGYHTFKLTLDGKEVSKGWNCQCGVVYNWMSMNDMIPHWCEDGGGDCDNPPTVSFDKSTYYEGDTVHITVHNPISGQVVDYEIIDCEGNSKESKALPYGTSSIYYTLPTVSSCCYWKICFYWNEGQPPLGAGSYCSKCYSFYVCPHETSCKVWVSVEDKYCKGYGVYVDGVYQFTEGESGTPDGYCRFWVTPGTHKFELRKNGCSVSKSWYCQCGTSYRWISMNDMYPHWCDCNKKPDLIVQDISWSPSSPKEGDTVTFTVKTKNQGSGNAGGFYVCYYVDGSYYARGYVSSLSAGSTTTTSFTWTADCGSHSIKAVADCYSDVEESNEGNNARTEYINIVCKPDLVVQDIFWSPSNPKQGDTVTVNVKTKNQGSESAGGFYVCYYVDGSYYARDYVSSLSDGSTTTTSFTWTADCGNHAIKAVADCYSDVEESNEGNNARTEYINIPCKPDLIVQDISWDKGSPKRGDTITFYVKVKNQGSGSAGTSTVKYYIDGSYVTSDSVPGLSAGSTSTQTFTWKANKCGNITVAAVADTSYAVDESNEGNNRRVETVHIECPPKEKPDLIISDISMNPSNPKVGDKVTFTATVKNIGKGIAKESYIDFSCTNINAGNMLFLKEHLCPSLKPEEIYSCYENKEIKNYGKYKIGTYADNRLAVDESNESNNVKYMYFTVPCVSKKPDLTISDISMDPSNPKQGDNVEFAVTVKNIGKETAGKSHAFIVGINRGANKELFRIEDSCPSLKPGEIYTYYKNAKMENCGEYQLMAWADAGGEVNESNENNNYRVASFKIPCEKPKITISRGLNDYKPLEVFTRGSKIQVKLENADNGEHIFSYLVWVDFNSDLTINKEDQWVSKYSFTSNKQEFDCEIPKDCPIGLYKLQVEIGGKKYISNNFFVIFDPDTGLSLQEIKNYWKDEETGNRKEGLLPHPPKFETSHHSEEVMTCMASAASIYEQFPRDRETAMKAFQDWIKYNTFLKGEFSPESSIKKLVLKIKSGDKITPSDCDVRSAFLVSLARASGIPARTIYGSSIGYGWNHAWVEAYYGGAWQVWDPTWEVEFGTDYPGFIDYHKKRGKLGERELARVNDELGVDRFSDYTTKKEKPDLTISDISMSPSSPKQGDDVKFTVTVKNIGKGAAKKSTSLIYLINGDKQTLLFLYFPSCPPLGPGETHTYTKNAKIEDCGEYRFRAFVDVSKEVDESNEENNRRVKSFTVPCPKEEETLVVNVYSIDGKPAAEVKGTTTIELIKSGEVSPTAKQNIDDKSRVTFTDIPAGNYYINVYHNPQLEQGSKEFWGQRKDVAITAGKTTTIDFHRYNPYVEKFYAEKNSVEVNTPVKINVGIKVPSNCPGAEAYVKALVIIRDENGHEVYRKESDDRKVQKGDSTTFSFSYTPTEEGTYSGLAKAYIVGGGELCTDNCGWVEVFNVGEKPKEDYSALIKCISSETDFYNIYSESFFDGTWWNTKARTEMDSVWNTLVITSAKSGAQTAIVLKNKGTISKVLGSKAFTAVSFIFNVADITKTTLKAVGYSQIGASITEAGSESIRKDLYDLIENGNNLMDALSENNESRIENLLQERAYHIKDIYADLSVFDENVFFHLNNPTVGPATFPSWKYAMIHETAGALRCQLQLDYLVTISELNNLTGVNYNLFLHEEVAEGKITPKRLDNTPLKAWCFGCLDYAGDTDNFIVKVPKSSLPLFLEICTAYNLTFELKGNGVDIKKDKFLETPISEGTYTLTVICKGCPQAYSFYAISGVKYVYAIAPDIQPAEGPCIEYPSPHSYGDCIYVDKSSITLEEEVTVDVIFKNQGGTSAWQSIAISSPDIKNTESYTILGSNLDYCEKYDLGYEAGYNYGDATKPLIYPLVEGAKNNWDGEFTGKVKLKIKPEKEGILRIYAKSVAYGSGVWRSDPKIFETSTKDQQNEYVYVKEITVTGVKHRIKLDVSTDKTICAPGDIVKLHASVRDLDGNPASATVSYEILGADIKGTMPGLEGEYSYGARVPETPGDYLVKITAKAMGDEVSGTLPITVLSGNIGVDVSSISVKMFLDSVSSQQITISNIGSADLKEVTLSSSGDVSSWISFRSPEVDWQQSTNSFERISAEGDTDRAVTATITTLESVSIGTYSGEIKIHSLGSSSATIPVTVEVIKHEKEVETDRKSLSDDSSTGWDVYKKLGDFEGLGDTYNLNPGPILLTTSKKAVCTFDPLDIGLENVDPLGNMIVKATVISEVDENNDYIAVYVNGKYYDCLNPLSGLQEGENSLRVYFDVASAGGVARKNGDNTIEMKASRNIEIEDVKVTPGLYNYESRDWGDSFSLSSDEVENLQSAHLQFDVKAMSGRNMFPVYVYFNDEEVGALTAEWGEGWNEDQKISIDIDEVGSKNSVVLKTYTNGIYNIKNAQFYYTYLK